MLGEYCQLIEGLLEDKHNFVKFGQSEYKAGDIILRHDIDFDCDLAFNMAKEERDIGISSSYFFMISSDTYNLLSKESRKVLEGISKMGHDVSLHYDHTVYDDFDTGLHKEIGIFENLSNNVVDIISLHNPGNSSIKTAEVETTYDKKYIEDILYISDSRNSPINIKKNSITQLLIHPVWWSFCGDSNSEKILGFLRLRGKSLKDKFRTPGCLSSRGYKL